MSRVRFQLFGRNQLTGRDFVAFEEGEIRTLNTSPDEQHLIRIVSTESGSVILDNLSNIPFDFTVSGFVNSDVHVYARCQYVPGTQSIRVNNNWSITVEGATNIMIGGHDPNVVSPFLNVRFHSNNFRFNRMGRLDVTINDQATSSMFFERTELLFISLEGNAAEDNMDQLKNHLVAIGTEME